MDKPGRDRNQMSGHYAADLKAMENKYISAREIVLDGSEEGIISREDMDILSSSFANVIRHKGYLYRLSELPDLDTFIYTNSHIKGNKVEICDIRISRIDGRYKWGIREVLDYGEYKRLEENINKVEINLTKEIEKTKQDLDKEIAKKTNALNSKITSLNDEVTKIWDTAATSLTLTLEDTTLEVALLNKEGIILSKGSVVLPSGGESSKIESIKYDEETEELIFIYADGEETRASISSLIDSLATKEELETLQENVSKLLKDSLEEVVSSLTDIINELNKKVETYKAETDESIKTLSNAVLYYDRVAKTYDDLKEALSEDGYVTLMADIDVENTITVPYGVSVTLDLNGHTIYNTNDIWSSVNWSLICVKGDLTIVGDGTLRGKENDCYCIDLKAATLKEGGTLTINGGNYYGNLCCIYVEYGFVTINDGYFDIQQLDTGSDPYKFVLNCYDSSFKSGDALFTAYGGSYVNFNPAVAHGPKDDEGNATYEVVIPEGYHVESKILEEENVLYTVVEDEN